MKKITSAALSSCNDTVKSLADEIGALPSMKWSEISPDNSALIIVDVVNGFIREGAMASSDIEDIIKPIALLMKRFNEKEMPVVALADCHKKDCAEFASFPEH